MKKLLLIILFSTLSCSTNETEDVIIENQLPKNELELSINEEIIDSDVINISAYYICDEKIYINAQSKIHNVTSDLFNLVMLKNGELVYSNFVDKSSSPTTNYSTSNFIPSSTLNIENFEFIENEILNVNLNGKLLKKTYNLYSIPEQIEIKGKIKIKEFGESICNTFNNFIKLDNSITFQNISTSLIDEPSKNIIEYEANSLNGYNIQFTNFTEFIQNMELGTYSFDSSIKSEKIEFRKYIGIPKVFSLDTEHTQNHWKFYETKGSFTIIEKTIINEHRIVKVKLNFSASYNGIIEHNFSEGLFEISY